MIPRLIRPLAQALYENRDYRFWLCQFTGWAGYSLATFLSITLLDDNVTWPHIEHIVLQAVLGILCTWPLRPIYRHTFERSLLQRILVSSAAVVSFSAVWTAARMQTFAWMSGETSLWSEFNYWYFGSLFVFLSWTVLYYGINYYELFLSEHRKLLEESARREKERSRRLEAESSAREAKLRMLRYQLNPHFLFNTLNSINALVKLDETDRASEMIQLLSRFLRHSLDQDDTHSVSLDQELESLMLYLDIEKVRFEDRLQLEIDIEQRARRALVPGLILQPIVENSMKYAVGKSESGGTVRVAARVVDDALELEVSDSGPGIADMEDPQGRGVGLRNTRQRLGALYDGAYTFSTTNVSPTGLAVRMSFPFLPRTDAGEPEEGH